MPAVKRVPSPCRARCGLNVDQCCVGCGRTLAEIVFWNDYPPAQQQSIVAAAATCKTELQNTEVVSPITLELAQSLRDAQGS